MSTREPRRPWKAGERVSIFCRCEREDFILRPVEELLSAGWTIKNRDAGHEAGHWWTHQGVCPECNSMPLLLGVS